MSERRTVTVPEAARILGISRNALYEAIAKGEFPLAIRVGRRIIIGREALLRFIGAGEGGDEGVA